jgi:hypothetical protein
MNQTSVECCGQLSERCQSWSTKVKLSQWRKASSNPRFVRKSGSQMVCRPCCDAFEEVLKVPEVLARAREAVATEQRRGRSAQAKPVRTPRLERHAPLKKRRSNAKLLADSYRSDRLNAPNMAWLQQRPEAMDNALLLGAGSTASSMPNMVEEQPVDLGILAFVNKAIDKQNTDLYKAVLMDEGIVQRLIDLDHYSDALVIDIIAVARQAWDLPGLTAEERSARLYLFSFLNFCIWGERIFIPGSKGVSTESAVSGLVPNSLLAVATNTDGLHLLRRTLLPDLIHVEKSFSNDNVECYFAEIVRMCGYKPDTNRTEGVCGSIETLCVARSDPTKEFHAFFSTLEKVCGHRCGSGAGGVLE